MNFKLWVWDHFLLLEPHSGFLVPGSAAAFFLTLSRTRELAAGDSAPVGDVLAGASSAVPA